jgi:pimeloyl-ACP methyl ester carboxylesterase
VAWPTHLQPYDDRRHAGVELAARLRDLKGRPDVVVLALPRGGVPVAYEVARKLPMKRCAICCTRLLRVRPGSDDDGFSSGHRARRGTLVREHRRRPGATRRDDRRRPTRAHRRSHTRHTRLLPSRVEAPTLLIVGGDDTPVIDMNRDAMRRMRAPVQLEIVPGATHLFQEPGTLEQVARLAADWCRRHLKESTT